MSVQDNKELLRRFFNILNAHKLERLDEVCDTDFVYHSNAGEHHEGLDDFKTNMNQGFQGLPDMELSMEELAAEGDKVYCVYRWTGTHKGDLLGIPPSNQKVDIMVNTVVTCRDGKITDMYDFYDAMTMLQQIGAVSDEVRPGGRDWPTGGTTLRPQ